jgi:sulfatase maturation enzyme AslB (radical SAM superfamily)
MSDAAPACDRTASIARHFVSQPQRKAGLKILEVLAAWKSILTGSAPMMSIEVTRECPLSCPGCYAYGDMHLGGSVNLRNLSDYRGNDLVDGIVRLVQQHRPLHVSLVGGEPLVRHRELSRVLPILSGMNVHTMVVTSAVIPIPMEWMSIPKVRVTISVDGLPEHHDVRRKPATYDRILKNIAGCHVNMHGTITRPMLERSGYIEEYISFWNARPEIVRIWISLYTPQKDEHTSEMLKPAERDMVAAELPALRVRYPKLLANRGISNAICVPPASPKECMFARMSTNYSADLATRVEPCIFGGNPDCSQCGCAISSGLHWLKDIRLGSLIKLEKIAKASIVAGSFVGGMRRGYRPHDRWTSQPAVRLVKIDQLDARQGNIKVFRERR